MSQAALQATAAKDAHIADGHKSLARAAVTMPHDPATIDALLAYGVLRPFTQRARLSYGAAGAKGL